MEEKRVDLIAEKQKKLLERLVNELSHEGPGYYYQSTNEIAMAIKAYVNDGAKLTQDDRALIDPLSWRDIQTILSHH